MYIIYKQYIKKNIIYSVYIILLTSIKVIILYFYFVWRSIYFFKPPNMYMIQDDPANSSKTIDLIFWGKKSGPIIWAEKNTGLIAWGKQRGPINGSIKWTYFLGHPVYQKNDTDKKLRITGITI